MDYLMQSTENWRKLSVSKEILYLWVTLDKLTLHAEAKNIRYKRCFILSAITRIVPGAFFFYSFRNGIILH